MQNRPLSWQVILAVCFAKQTGNVYGMGAVVAGIAVLFIATLVHKVADNKRLQAGFLDIGGHTYPCVL